MKKPVIKEHVFIAPSADVMGDVILEEGSSVWYQCVIRGDSTNIHIGKNTNIQDGCVLHADPGRRLCIGEGVTIGHGAIIHCSYIGDNSLIGMGATVLDGAKVGRNCIIGAGALVTGGTEIPDGMMALGSPAKVRRALTEDEIQHNRFLADEYVRLAKEHMER